MRKIYQYRVSLLESRWCDDCTWDDVKEGYHYRVEEEDGTLVVDHVLAMSNVMINDDGIKTFMIGDCAICNTNPNEWKTNMKSPRFEIILMLVNDHKSLKYHIEQAQLQSQKSTICPEIFEELSKVYNLLDELMTNEVSSIMSGGKYCGFEGTIKQKEGQNE